MKGLSKNLIFRCLSNQWFSYCNLSRTTCTSPLGYSPEMVYRVTYWFCLCFITTQARSFNNYYRRVNSWYLIVVNEGVLARVFWHNYFTFCTTNYRSFSETQIEMASWKTVSRNLQVQSLSVLSQRHTITLKLWEWKFMEYF